MSGGEGFSNRAGVAVDSAVDAGPLPLEALSWRSRVLRVPHVDAGVGVARPLDDSAGLALFYGGMSRSKSVLNMMMMSFSALAWRHRLRPVGLVDDLQLRRLGGR